MDINKKTKISIKKYMLIYTLGYLHAIKAGIVDMEYQYFDEELELKIYARQPYFKIATTSWLEENKFEQSFVDLIYLVIELEDVHSMSLGVFNESLNGCISMATEELRKIPQFVEGMDNIICNKVFDFIWL